ncbi:MAG: PQQ-binding-like beta-propeller repeat protein [Candidatus Aminicenantaceae bacterium]
MILRISRCLLVVFILIASMSLMAVQEKNNETNWPSFRGLNARGFSDGRPTPVTWNIESKKNIEWKTAIPGLAHSSPIIWGNRIFITTAISEEENPELKTGLYGTINPVEEDTVHQWIVYCLDKKTGKILWEQTAHEGVPKAKRHPMATHANSTAATDGNYVVAFFGSEGLYCYTMDGKLVWKKDFGVLSSAYFSVPTAQWGFASSPVIHDGVVVVQCDALNIAFLAALDLKTGKELWRTPREDYPTWSTPAIHVGEEKTQIIVNGFKHIGGYDFQTGEELWKIVGGGDIPIPTPVVAGDLVYINSAHGRMSPIYAIKLDAQGDITLKNETSSNDKIVWSVRRGGAYIQTPLIYGDYLYNLNWNGSLICFHAKTGEQIYKEQLGKMEAFAASGVAADGKLYFTSQEGDVYVVKAGPNFEILATNSMNDENLATPAISDGKLYFRTHHYLVAVAEK